MFIARSLALLVLITTLAACGAPAITAPAPSPSTAGSASAPASTSSSITAAASQTAETAATIAAGGTLTVFAAASLTEAFTEIGQQFDAANGSQTAFNFAGSQQLAQQLAQGAPADVFASANTREMNAAIAAGEVISGTQRTFVRNRLVVVYPADNLAGLQDLEDLAKPGVNVVLAAKEVPAGQYSRDFLAKASESGQFTAAYSETVLANVVSYEENVRAVLSKVALGEADAGIVYTSDVGQDAADQVGRIDIPDDLNTIATYPIAPVASGQNEDLAQRFIEYVLGTDGQQILTKRGFLAAASQ